MRWTLLLICSLAWGQNVDPKLTFDVASIKPAAMPTPGRGMIRESGPPGGPGTKDPGRVRYPFTTLKNLMMIAYDVKSYQISGPSTIDTERFEVQATMPPETTKEQFRVMLQNLLAERFLLKLHRETRELPEYSLVVGKKGPKLKESEPGPEEDKDAPPPPPPMLNGPPKMGPDGFPLLPLPNGGRGRLIMMMMPNRARMMAQGQTMQDLANRLTGMMDKQVSDATGLTAKYDFTLTFSPEGVLAGMMMLGPPPPGGGGFGLAGGPAGNADANADAPPDLFSALQSQLGLKLEAKKGPVEMLVIDHVEKAPTEN
jgi:uncharacterized protein (TIGR03435 family)